MNVAPDQNLRVLRARLIRSNQLSSGVAQGLKTLAQKTSREIVSENVEYSWPKMASACCSTPLCWRYT
jgi:hypothetical protein